MKASIEREPRTAAVLSRAYLRAAELIGLSRAEAARVTGVSEASLSRLAHGGRAIDRASKEGELAVLFLRVFRSLDTLVGGSEADARKWMRAHNHHLGGVPAELVQQASGLVHVVEYLDGMRGKL